MATLCVYREEGGRGQSGVVCMCVNCDHRYTFFTGKITSSTCGYSYRSKLKIIVQTFTFLDIFWLIWEINDSSKQCQGADNLKVTKCGFCFMTLFGGIGSPKNLRHEMDPQRGCNRLGTP